MYHVELRQFPHNFCRFNLSERELHDTILDAWLRGEWIELGERRWNPQQAKLTVLEGPELPVQELSMGRGWRNAKREGQDVSERLLSGTAAGTSTVNVWRRMVGPGGGGSTEQPAPTQSPTVPDATVGTGTGSDARLAGDSLGLEVLAKLGSEPQPLTIVWQLARERYPENSASDCLKLAELAIRSLTEAELAVVLVANRDGEYELCGAREQVEQALRAIDSWSSSGGSVPARLRRA
ncbi:MAG: hypothetical protein WBQ21_06535 [Solirubrobacteraceae bacterium]